MEGSETDSAGESNGVCLEPLQAECPSSSAQTAKNVGGLASPNRTGKGFDNDNPIAIEVSVSITWGPVLYE